MNPIQFLQLAYAGAKLAHDVWTGAKDHESASIEIRRIIERRKEYEAKRDAARKRVGT